MCGAAASSFTPCSAGAQPTRRLFAHVLYSDSNAHQICASCSMCLLYQPSSGVSPSYSMHVLSRLSRLAACRRSCLWFCRPSRAVGCVCCSHLPFDDDNVPNLFRKIKGGVYTLPSYLTDGPRSLISKMLSERPLLHGAICCGMARSGAACALPFDCPITGDCSASQCFERNRGRSFVVAIVCTRLCPSTR